MRKPAQPSYNFFARIDPDTDKRRRRLQMQLDCSASELVERAFLKLEACLDDASGRPQASTAA